MQSTSSFIEQLLEDETYLESVSPLTSQGKQVHRLAVSLLVACMYQQLQTKLGKELVLRILEKHTHRIKISPDNDVFLAPDFTASSIDGNRLLGTLLPGKKSVIMRIIAYYAKLPYKHIDLIVDLCAYKLFTKLAFESAASTEELSVLLPLNELERIAPELNSKDYIAIGFYSLSLFTIAAASV